MPPLQASIRDPETGLYSRLYFDEVIGRELERVKRHGFALSVVSVVLDLDGLGMDGQRDAVREAVVAAGQVLSANTRETDFVFRWEEDEFLVLLFEADDPARERKVELLKGLYATWGTGSGPFARAVPVRIGSGTLEEGRVFAGVLQAARAAARQPA